MKKNLLLFSFLLIVTFSFAQQTIEGTITHDNMARDYIMYVPANYTGDEPVPLVFNFHGFTSNATEQMWYGDFRSIADTAGFIIVHPEGTEYLGNTHFNVGGFTMGSTVDDVGFTEALLDSIAADKNIDMTRVYSTGMSNGGFMSFLLACQMSDKIAAVASVTGSMTPETYNACDPQHPMPILQIHGTADAVVPYDGTSWTKSIDEVMEYWTGFNNCNETPFYTEIDDVNVLDLTTVEHFVYADGDLGATSEHFKVSGGSHSWAGTFLPTVGTNYDIDASAEIWKFFSRYDINGLITITDVDDLVDEKTTLNIYPNPTQSIVSIEITNFEKMNYRLFSPMGKELLSGVFSSNQEELDLSALPVGIYYLQVEGQSHKILKIEE